MVDWARLPWDRITALCSMTVAVVSLLFSVWQAAKIRQHNRLSLSPALVFWENSDWEVSPQGLSIRNDGVGPAFIDSVVVFERERRKGPWDDATWASMAQTLAIPDAVMSNFARAQFESGAVVRQGGEWLLWGFTKPSRDHVRWINALGDRFGFVIWYRSAYDDETRLPIYERNLPTSLRMTN